MVDSDGWEGPSNDANRALCIPSSTSSSFVGSGVGNLYKSLVSISAYNCSCATGHSYSPSSSSSCPQRNEEEVYESSEFTGEEGGMAGDERDSSDLEGDDGG